MLSRSLSRRLAAVLLPVLLGTAAALPATTQTPSQAATPLVCVDPWTDRELVMHASFLSDVVGTPTEAWAVGMRTPSHDARSPIGAYWNGTAWIRLDVPPTTDETGFFGIDRSPSGRIWAVGYDTRARVYRPMIARLDGTTLRRVRVPRVRGGGLLAVSAISDSELWAVGYRVRQAGERPLVIHRVGRTTEVVTLPGLTRGTAALQDVGGSSPGDVWAAGWRTLEGVTRPYLVHWDGSSWRPADVGRAEGVLTSLAVAAPDVAWAVGYSVVDGAYQPIVMRWDGQSWQPIQPPAADSPIAFLRSVAIDGAGGALAVGTRWNLETGRWEGFGVRWDGGAWTDLASPPLTDPTDFDALVAGPAGSSALVVGGRAGDTLALDWCPPGDASAQLPGAQLPGAQTLTVHPSAPDAGHRSTGTSRQRAGRAAQQARGRLVARDVAREAGLAAMTVSWGGVTADFDGNGWPDLFLSRHAGPGWLALNRGGRFRSPPGEPFPRYDRHGCTVGDVNGDERPDMYCATGARRGASLKLNELWLQAPDGTFTDGSVVQQAGDPLGRGRFVSFFDLDHDAYPDLFVANKPPRTDGLPSRHLVLINPDGTRYLPRTTEGFDDGGGADCLRAVDLDRDGWEDLLLCEKVLNRRRGYGLRFLRNERGTLRDRTARLGIEREQDRDALAVDLNGDRRPDLVEVTPANVLISLQERSGRFVRSSRLGITGGLGVAAGDADGDGDQDLYFVRGSRAGNLPDRLMLNSGDGIGFTDFPIPQVQAGRADSAIPIDHDRNGLTDFLVLNGKGGRGPVQLVAFFRERS
jgi:hypothetical protein